MNEGSDDRLERLYEEAQALPPSQRGTFLDEHCADNAALRSELESLLAEGEGAVTFMDDLGRLVDPAGSAPPDRLVQALADRYAIEERIGEGGMATVYRARDLRHDRNVALKVLRPELAVIVGAQRFLDEIKTTANLQHPNILPLFDSGEADGYLFYVMPYVEGETLRTRLERERQLPVDESVRMATSMAEALDYAHRQGVVHRDIKPANVLLAEGKPVIADFGIALAVRAGGGTRLTQTGLSLGTPYYMSPEQATGEKHVGPATDIYALGCVLYEMLAGEPPFTGSTIHAVLSRVLSGEVKPVSSSRTAVPTHVDDAIAKALQRVPADRFRTGAEFAAALNSPEFGATARERESRRSAGRVRTLAGYAVAAAAAALFTWWIMPRAAPRPEAVRRVLIPLPEEAPLLDREGFRLLDDGSGMVYGGPGDEGVGRRLWTLRWASLEPSGPAPIPGSDRATQFDPSPDADAVALQVGESIRVQSLQTSTSRLVVSEGVSCCIRWQDDGWIYFTNAAGGLSRVPAEGGAVQVLTENAGPQLAHARPVPLDGGKYLVFEKRGLFGIGSQIALLDRASGEIVDLAEGAHPSVVGDFVFFTNGTTDQLRVAELRGTSLGTPNTIVAISRSRFDPYQVSYDLTPSGDLMYAVAHGEEAEQHVPVWVTRDGQEERVSPDLAGPFGPLVRLSPDGRRLALRTGRLPQNIYVWQLQGGPVVPITRDGTINYRMSWTPDGSGLYYSSNRLSPGTSVPEVFRVRADGVGDPQRMGLESPSATLSADSAWWVFRTPNIGGDRGNLMAQSTAAGSEPVVLVATDAEESQVVVSPDGSWFAYSSDITGVRNVFVRPFPDASTRTQVSLRNGHSPAWSPSTNEVFYVGEDRGMWSVRYRLDPQFSIVPGSRTRLFDVTPYAVDGTSSPHSYDVSNDAERFIMIKRSAVSEIHVEELVLVQNILGAVDALRGR